MEGGRCATYLSSQVLHLLLHGPRPPPVHGRVVGLSLPEVLFGPAAIPRGDSVTGDVCLCQATDHLRTRMRIGMRSSYIGAKNMAPSRPGFIRPISTVATRGDSRSAPHTPSMALCHTQPRIGAPYLTFPDSTTNNDRLYVLLHGIIPVRIIVIPLLRPGRTTGTQQDIHSLSRC
jgi:hypothetical protein